MKTSMMEEALFRAKRFEQQALAWQSRGFEEAMRDRNRQVRHVLEHVRVAECGSLQRQRLVQEAELLFARSKARDAVGIKEDPGQLRLDALWNGHGSDAS